MDKYLLCRPQGGLNDILCQIEKCCRYAEKTHRIVIVDTNYKHSESFHENLSYYFESRQNRLFLSLEDAPVDLEQLDVYPECLQGKLNSYQTSEKVPFQPFKERSSGQAIEFDFAKDYPHQLLVHHQGGGGKISSSALLRLKLTDYVKQALIKRFTKIDGSYWALHIRHTDYHTDYNSAIELIKKYRPPRLFISTDNQLVLDEIISKLPETKILTFSKNLSKDGAPIHKTRLGNKIDSEKNMDALLDLLMLSMATQLIICKISGGNVAYKLPTYSGFSLLSNQLWENKVILNHLLKPSKIKFGLD
jgi:hypothetical protein